MRQDLLKKNKERCLFVLLPIFLMMVVIGYFFDCYYDLNDDVLMKDIIAGIHSGAPSGYNIQMLFPISFAVSLFYRLVPALPWYGIFLCACHLLCFALVLVRLNERISDKRRKVLVEVAFGTVILAAYLWEAVFMQYTVICTLLAATAAFWLSTTKEDLSVSAFLKSNIVSILLVILAFYIRTEMLLLVAPFLAVTGLLTWSREKKWNSSESLKKYLGMMGLIIVGMAAGYLVHIVAYGSSEWKEFQRFFDARTEVYDFYYEPPKYDENVEFYNSIGMTNSEYQLLLNYNFGLDDKMDATLMEKIQNYADSQNIDQISAGRIIRACKDYYYLTVRTSELPWNFFVLLAYAILLVLVLYNHNKTYIWKIPALILFRSVPWMYIAYRGRAPERITHSLFLIELLILFSLLMLEIRKNKKGVQVGVLLVFMLAALSFLPTSVSKVQAEQIRREQVNLGIQSIQEYCKKHKELYYFIDVYSTVDYSEKAFEDVDNSMRNYDILGGWACKSPVSKQALATYGIKSQADALLLGKAEFIATKASNVEWMKEYYKDQGILVTIETVDQIMVPENEGFLVYKLSETKEGK